MKDYKNFIMEIKMTVQDALKVFGLTSVPTDKELSIRYKELAKKFHPDRGGSVSDMQRLNAANDYLKSYAGTDHQQAFKSQKDINKEYWNLAAGAKAILKKKFKPEAYTAYFENIFQKRFTANVTFYPEKKEGASPYYAGIKAKFSSDDGESYFDLDISIYLTDMRRNTSLSGADIDINLHVVAYGFHNNRKQKMAQRDWKFTNTHSILEDPKAVFPEAKLKKSISAKNKKFTRKDAQLFLEKKLNANVTNDCAWIPLEDGIQIVICRQVYMRVPVWIPNGIYKKGNMISKRVRMLSVWTMPETEAALKELEKLINKAKKTTDLDEIDKILHNLKNTKFE